MTGTSVQVIRWMVGQDQTTVWDVKKHTEKRSLSQNAYFHVLLGKIADAMRLPKPVVHNMMIRRYGQAQGIAGRLVTVAIPDTEKAEKERSWLRRSTSGPRHKCGWGRKARCSGPTS